MKNRWQRTKVNSSFSPWSELTLGVPQGSVLGPVLFNIYLNDLLWFMEDCDVCNYADDTTIYACDKALNEVIRKLEISSNIAINWFNVNYMKLNSGKCKVIICGHKSHQITLKVGDSEIKESQWVKLLGVKIDNKLTFDEHISKIVKKANSKLAVVKRSLGFLTFYKRKILLNSFVQSQFTHAPLVWMLHTKTANNKINRVHYKFLKTLYDDHDSTFKQLLDKEGTFTVHEKNIQTLLIQMFKAKHDLGPPLLKEIFKKMEYTGPTLRGKKDFVRPNIETKNYGEKSLEIFGNKLWKLLPKYIEKIDNLDTFKYEIKQWKPDKCPCYLCKDFIKGVGLVDLCNCKNC